MEKKTTQKTTQKKKTNYSKTTTPTVEVEVKEKEITTEIKPVIVNPEPTPAPSLIPKDIDLEQYVTVKNGFHGRLIYISNRTKERFVWEEFGDEQEIQLRELRDAKNSKKEFFINNYFMFEETWVIDWLGLSRFYKHSINTDSFDEIFTKSVEELTSILADMTEAQKRSVGYRARHLISTGEIDSMKVVNTLEKVLKLDLVEK